MKKIISVLICFTFLLSFSLIASAEGKVTVSFVPSTETVHQNEQFSVTIDLNNASGKNIYAAQMYIAFDNKNLDFLSVSPKYSNYTGGGEGELTISQTDNFISVLYLDNDLKTPLQKDTKEFFALNFKVKATGALGDISFSNFSATETVFGDYDGKEIPYDVISKTMKIVSGTAPATTTTTSTTAKTIAGETTAPTTKEITITTMDTDATTVGGIGNTTITNATDSNGNTIISPTTKNDGGTPESSNTALIIIIITAIVVLIGAGTIFFMMKQKNKNIE